MTNQLSSKEFFRRPKQLRGIQRFESLLDAAHELLAKSGSIEELSLYDVAKLANLSPGGTYHFFPNPEAICAALVERYNRELREIELLSPPQTEYDTLEDLVSHSVRIFAEYLNRNRPAVLLFSEYGFHPAITVTEQKEREINIISFAQNYRKHFQFPDYFDIEKLINHTHQIAICMLQISYRRHDAFTEEYIQEASKAALAYLESYVGKYLPRKTRPSSTTTCDAKESLTNAD